MILGISSVMWQGRTKDYLNRLAWIYENMNGNDWVPEEDVDYVEKADGRQRFVKKQQEPWLLSLKSYEMVGANKIKIHAMNLLDCKKVSNKWFWRLNQQGIVLARDFLSLPGADRSFEEGATALYRHLVKYSPFTRAFLWNLGKINRLVKVKKYRNDTVVWGNKCENVTFIDESGYEILPLEAISAVIVNIPEIVGRDIRQSIETKFGIRIENPLNIVRTSKLNIDPQQCTEEHYPSLNKCWTHFTLNNELMDLLIIEEENQDFIWYKLNKEYISNVIIDSHIISELLEKLDFEEALWLIYNQKADGEGWVNIARLREPVIAMVEGLNTGGLIEAFDYRLQKMILNRKINVQWKAAPKELGPGYFDDCSKTYMKLL